MNHVNTWHTAHLILTIITGSLWGIVWIWRASSNTAHNRKVDKAIQLEQTEVLKRVARLIEKQLEGMENE